MTVRRRNALYQRRRLTLAEEALKLGTGFCGKLGTPSIPILAVLAGSSSFGTIGLIYGLATGGAVLVTHVMMVRSLTQRARHSARRLADCGWLACTACRQLIADAGGGDDGSIVRCGECSRRYVIGELREYWQETYGVAAAPRES